MNLLNESKLEASWMTGQVHYPASSLTAIVKGTFALRLGQPAEIAPVQRPVGGDEGLYPSDYEHFKPRADVVLVGLAPGGKRTRARVGNWVKSASAFAPIPLASPERAKLMGTHDEKWLMGRWPWYPEDADWGFAQAAPRDQQIEGYLRGDDKISIDTFECGLPGLRVRCLYSWAAREIPMNLDTLWVDVAAQTLVLVWRGVIDAEPQDADPLLVVCESLKEEPATDLAAVMERRLAPEVVPAEPMPVPDGPPPEEVPAIPRAQCLELLANRESLRGVDLRGADLSGLDLSSRDLREATLSRANLRGTNLSGANLHRADLFEADLTDADLSAADLSRADLSNALLRGAKGSRLLAPKAIFEGADLSEADLTEASLEEADLSRARLDKAVLNRANLRRAKLHGAWGFRVRAEGADFTEGGARGAYLVVSHLLGIQARLSVWDQAQLYRCELSGGNFDEASFTECDLRETTLDKASFKRANFQRADLCGAHGKRVNFFCALLHHADLSDANLRDSNLFKADCHKAALKGICLDGSNIKRTFMVLS